MTLDELREYPREFLTPAQVAPILGTNPQGIRVWARQASDRIGFPVIVIGNRVKIPRRGFINYMEGKGGGESA